MTISGGAVKLVSRSFDGTSIAVVSGDGGGGGGVESGDAQWRVVWANEPSVFLSAAAVNQLSQLVETGLGCGVVLKRIATQPSETVPGTVEETDEDFNGRGVTLITLEDLLSPGNKTAIGEYNLTPGEVTEDDKTAAAAGIFMCVVVIVVV